MVLLPVKNFLVPLSIMNKLENYITYGFPTIIISSPRAVGKTSFLQLLCRDKPIRDTKYCYVKMDVDVSPFDTFCRAGLVWSDIKRTWSFPLEWRSKRVIVIMDDAQAVYTNELFWSILFRSPGDSLPNNFILVIACTYLLSVEVEFKACLSKIEYSDFLLSEEQSLQLVQDSRMGLHSRLTCYPILVKLIVNDCNGHIGALRITIDELNVSSNKKSFANQNEAIASYLNHHIQTLYSRCWSFQKDATWDSLIEKYLIKLIGNVPLSAALEYHPALDRLIKVGILLVNVFATNSIQFSGQLAKRFFYHKIYSNINRASGITFHNLQDLVIQAVKQLSAHVLQQSAKYSQKEEFDDFFPQPDTFQHLFMQSLLKLTPSHIKIIPELGKSFISQTIPRNEIDFYVKNNGNDVDWGIELVVSGKRRIEENIIKRFAPPATTKYEGLQCKDSIVIDFRWGKASSNDQVVFKHEKKITVFFNCVNFKTCSYIVGYSNNIVTLELDN